MSLTQAVPEWSVGVNEFRVCSFDTQKVKQSHCYYGWEENRMQNWCQSDSCFRFWRVGLSSSGNLWLGEAWATQRDQDLSWPRIFERPLAGLLQAGAGAPWIPARFWYPARLKQWSTTQTGSLHLGSSVEAGKASRGRRQLLGLVSHRPRGTPWLQRDEATSAPWLECGERHALVKARRLQHARASRTSRFRSGRVLQDHSGGFPLMLCCRLRCWCWTVSGSYPLWSPRTQAVQVGAGEMTQLVRAFWPRHICHKSFERTVSI